MDSTTGQVLYEKESHSQRPCASITKVMTLLLVFEAIDSGKISMTDEVCASAHAASMGGSDIWLEEGEIMSVDDLIKATMVASANDAAVALAEHVCGSEEAFVSMMNKRAKELKMSDTVFKNCNGLDEEGHITSAFDVAVMSRELIKHKEIFNYCTIWMDTLRNGETQIVNTNKLLKTYNGITGLKTGTTNDAGCCISATAERNGFKPIAVVLGADNGKQRFADAAALLDYAFAGYVSVAPNPPEDLPSFVDVQNGMQKQAAVELKLDGSFLVEKGKESGIINKIVLNEEIMAPICKGDAVGTVKYYLDDKTIGEYSITAAEDVSEISFGEVLSLLFQYIVRF
ncbi:D-alanyl-D-alanine carboxypeptidase [Ruminococcus sp. zg-924]|nr:D-alanyl-D-alanine carboxypeptidase [Ruminococcus sp. zg-924]MCQ4115629.1 D-alanyl-D-alanine carboxypeptidase [Ruminococcus sp. zg-921]